MGTSDITADGVRVHVGSQASSLFTARRTASVAHDTATVHHVRSKRQRRWWERAFLHPWPTTPNPGPGLAGTPSTA